MKADQVPQFEFFLDLLFRLLAEVLIPLSHDIQHFSSRNPKHEALEDIWSKSENAKGLEKFDGCLNPLGEKGPRYDVLLGVVPWVHTDLGNVIETLRSDVRKQDTYQPHSHPSQEIPLFVVEMIGGLSSTPFLGELIQVVGPDFIYLVAGWLLVVSLPPLKELFFPSFGFLLTVALVGFSPAAFDPLLEMPDVE